MSYRAHTFGSPVGDLLVAVDERGALARVEFLTAGRTADAELADLAATGDGARWDAAACAPVVAQLDAYFRGARRRFELALAPRGTPFQLRVWRELEAIPWGTTTTYGALAARLGQPGAIRAVGRANGANPIAVVLPCHRVIGADGSLVGYGGGLEIKRFLLELEGVLPRQLF